jgi:DNA-3-methyladenine glycosylase
MRLTDLDFFKTDAVTLARQLLGKLLVRKINNKVIKARIVESEAYIGKIDKACYAHKENIVRREHSALYCRGGYTFVYPIYYSFCFNIVASVEGDPQGVLIRAVEVIESEPLSLRLKQLPTNGPAKLCFALEINRQLDKIDLITSETIYLEQQPEITDDKVVATKRVNVGYSGTDKDRL